MSAIGIGAVTKMFKDAMPGPIEPWHAFTNAEYAAYVELGTARSRAQPYMGPAAQKATAAIPELTMKAKSLNDLIRLIALRVEYLAKRLVPVDTGNLKRGIEAEKV